MSNADAAVVLFVIVGVVVGVGVLIVLWKLFLTMITHTTRAVRLGVQSDQDRTLMELGRLAAQEIARGRQQLMNPPPGTKHDPVLHYTTHVRPNCSAYVQPTDSECHKCGALFTDPNGWQPQAVQS